MTLTAAKALRSFCHLLPWHHAATASQELMYLVPLEPAPHPKFATKTTQVSVNMLLGQDALRFAALSTVTACRPTFHIETHRAVFRTGTEAFGSSVEFSRTPEGHPASCDRQHLGCGFIFETSRARQSTAPLISMRRDRGGVRVAS